jgi:hypothetical protein
MLGIELTAIDVCWVQKAIRERVGLAPHDQVTVQDAPVY